MTAMAGPGLPVTGVPVGYWCANVAYADDRAGMWWLGWEWFDTPARAVDWLLVASCLMAEQLGPATGHAIQTWADGDGPVQARTRLDQHQDCAFTVHDDGVRYELSVAPLDFPPLIGLDCLTTERGALA